VVLRLERLGDATNIRAKGHHHHDHNRPARQRPAPSRRRKDVSIDVQFGIEDARRYFHGSARVVERDDNDVIVQIDGTQGADGDVTRRIMIYDGNTEAVELSGEHARQLARALIAAADEVEQMANYDVK
jgi:hypothetical protein